MGEWQTFQLEEIVDQFIDYRGKTPKKTASGIPLITAKIVKSGKIFEPNEFISKEEYKVRMNRGYPKVNDVVLTTEAPLGEVALIKDAYVSPGQRVITIRGKADRVYNPFLKYYFQSDIGQYELHSRASGTTVFGIKAALLREVPVTLPSLDEQKTIANILLSLDDKIDLLHRQNKTLESLAETLFRQTFIENAEDDWETVCFEDITTRITDGAHKSPKSVEVGLPMASVKDMHQWGINTDTCRHIAEEDFEELVRADCKPLKHDILIAKDGSYLKHVFVAEEDLDVVILSSIAILRPNNKYHPVLLTIFLKLASTREQMENMVTGAVIPRIVLKDFRKFELQLPPKEVQEQALEKIMPMYEKCWENVRQIQTLENLRDTLLPKLMSGEIRVQYDGTV